MYTQLISIYTVLLSLLTASGVMLHDTRVDKAATLLASPISLSQYENGPKAQLSTEGHTHVERGGFTQAMRTYQTTTPGMPTHRSERKHMMQKHATKGHHAFDNYNLPLVS